MFDDFNTYTNHSYIKNPNCISSGVDSLNVSGIVDKSNLFFCSTIFNEDDGIDFTDTLRKIDFFKDVNDLQKIERTMYGQLFDNVSSNFDNFTRLGRFLNFSEFGDDTRILKRSFGKATPLRVIKNPVVDIFSSKTLKTFADDSDLLRFRFNDFESKLQQKPIPHTTYLTLKQKRYNVRNKIKPTTKVDENATVYSFVDEYSNTQKVCSVKQKKDSVYSKNPFLKNLSIIEDNVSDPTRQYRMLKKAKNRLDKTSINT